MDSDAKQWTERLVEFCQQMTTPAADVKRETDQGFTFTDITTGKQFAVMVFQLIDLDIEEVRDDDDQP